MKKIKEMPVGSSMSICNQCNKVVVVDGKDWKETYIQAQNKLDEHIRKEHSN